MAKDILFGAFYTHASQGAAGLTPSIDVHTVEKATGAVASIAAAAAMTELADGLYFYRVAAADLATYYYFAIAKTDSTDVDQQWLPAVQLDFGTAAGNDAGQVAVATLPDVTLAAAQPHYTPATAAALAAVQTHGDGAWATPSLAGLPAAIWTSDSRTLTALPDPAPAGYGGGGGLTDDQAAQLALAAERAALITGGSVTIVSPVAQNGQALTLTPGSDYLERDGTALLFSLPDGPDLTGATVTLLICNPNTWTRLNAAGVVTAPREIRVELTAEVTAQLTPGFASHELRATLANGDVMPPLVRGQTQVTTPV